jgi:cyclophilin family peptidyl-prolyl cis-trans isomerase
MNAYYTSIAGLAALLAGHAHATDVAVCTDRGRAVFELADAEAPGHVANFLRYVDMDFYAGTVFHRVVPDFVVQGGGVDRRLRGRPTLPPIESEADNGLKHERGTVAAARTNDPNSATSQFFVNLKNNASLNGDYTVFARVKEGLELFDEIAELPTGPAGPFKSDVPTPAVAIRSIARLDVPELAELPADGREAALKERIVAASMAGNHADALHLIGEYHAICGADDTEIALIEAQSALASGDRRRAVFVLEEYFATADSADPSYEAAAALYREAVPENQLSAAQLVDDCDAPESPDLSDGKTATRDEMLASQASTREFVAQGEFYLKCLSKIIDNEERSAVDRNMAITEHNRMVAAMEQAAAAFNEQLHAYKDRN